MDAQRSSFLVPPVVVSGSRSKERPTEGVMLYSATHYLTCFGNVGAPGYLAAAPTIEVLLVSQHAASWLWLQDREKKATAFTGFLDNLM